MEERGWGDYRISQIGVMARVASFIEIEYARRGRRFEEKMMISLFFFP